MPCVSECVSVKGERMSKRSSERGDGEREENLISFRMFGSTMWVANDSDDDDDGRTDNGRLT